MAVEHGNRHGARRWRVLAADDDPILRELMREKIGPEFDVECVEDGEVAWNRLSEDSFDIAIIDLNMPKLDGFGLIRHLRQTPKTVDLPIIVATSRGDSEAIERAFESGATSFVTKPVNWSLFAYQVRFVLKQGESDRDLRARLEIAQTGSRDKSFLLENIERAVSALLEGVSDTDDAGARLPADNSSGNVATDETGSLSRVAPGMGAPIKELLYLARLSNRSGRMPEDGREVAVHDLLNGVVLRGQVDAAKKPVRLVCRPTLERGYIRAAMGELSDALSRLVRNAVEASPPGGTVEILAHRQQDGSLVMTVRDNGSGMESARLERYLGPLYSLKQNAGDGPGIDGLGLQIVRHIAESYGGRLLIQSAKDRGTVAGIWLPAGVVRFEQLEQTA